MSPAGTSRAVRIGRRLALALAALLVLALLTFAIPVRTWRTGELPAPPLPVVESGPPVNMPARVWVDTDAACGHDRTTDPDDCFALLLLARSPSVQLVGLSTVFGNAPLSVTDSITRELVRVLEGDGWSLPPVHRGATAPLGGAGPAASTPAQAAIQRALAAGPMTLVSLGPLTNTAAALRDRPDLQANVARHVAVMGRRPGHLFHPAEGSGGGILFGHGPVFRDFNFDQDRVAASRVLNLGMPTTLVPYEAAREVIITAADLTRLTASDGAPRWVASRARGWLDFWLDDVGQVGFYPFDVLAAAYVLAPRLLSCAPAAGWVAEDEKLWDWLYSPEALLVGLERSRPANASASAAVIYCPEVSPTIHGWLMSRLGEGARAGGR